MLRTLAPAALIALLSAAALAAGQEPSTPGALSAWALDRSLSAIPKEVGFNTDWLAASGAGGTSQQAGARGRRGSGSGGAFAGSFGMPRESYEDARRVQLLTAEARNPPARLTLTDAGGAVTIAPVLGEARVFHPTGREESIDLQGVTLPVTSRRDGDRLVVTYRVEQDREIRYSYTRVAAPAQLIVDVEFIDKNAAGDKARLVYVTAPAAAMPQSPTGLPAASALEAFDQRPGAELRGLRDIGVLVEELSAQAVVCGFNRDILEAALARRLSDGGFVVKRNSDEDTYLYVNIITNSMPNGTCVSRYDTFLYTHATTKLTYRDQPVLATVSLMHRGGISSGAPGSHAAAVQRDLENYVSTFVTQIQTANR